MTKNRNWYLIAFSALVVALVVTRAFVKWGLL